MTVVTSSLPRSTPNATSAAIARHAIGMKRSGTRVDSRPGTTRQSVS